MVKDKWKLDDNTLWSTCKSQIQLGDVKGWKFDFIWVYKRLSANVQWGQWYIGHANANLWRHIYVWRPKLEDKTINMSMPKHWTLVDNENEYWLIIRNL